MKCCAALLFGLFALATVAHGNRLYNQSAFQKCSISSPLLFSCDDSELKAEISSLRQEIQQLCSIKTNCYSKLSQNEIQQLQQVCNVSVLISEISQIHKKIGMLNESVYAILSMDPVGSPFNPASNCSEIHRQDLTSSSGTFWLSTGGGRTKVFCDFNVQLPPSSPVWGWQEVANIDLNNPTDLCPFPLRENTSPSRRCEKSSDSGGCESVFFPTNRVPFSKLCGRVVGYAKGTPDAICPSCTIDTHYVDGISVTYLSSSGRQHIWTFIAEQLHSHSRCPCRNDNQIQTPSFVGNDYYCEVEPVIHRGTTPLWEGEGCTAAFASNAPCCENPNLPWFCREFDQPIVTDNIDRRLICCLK